MPDVIAFENWENLVDEQGIPTLRGIEFLQDLTNHVNLSTILNGTGSPEGVITAEPTALYMDDTGSAGSILYVKKTGSSDTGWVLV